MTRVTTATVHKCTQCGKILTSHKAGTLRCMECVTVGIVPCATCGKPLPKYTKATQCRDCWKARGAQPQRLCEKCGEPMNRYTLATQTMCRTCRTAPIPMCLTCGKPLNRGSKSNYCWECYTESRTKVTEKKLCSFKGCENPHAAKGLCAMHYELSRRKETRQGQHIDGSARTWVAQQPCQVCGYDRMRSHVHRIIAQGNYVLGNMVAVCARCHDEIHRGLTPCPEATIPA